MILTLGKSWRIENGAYTILPPALAHAKSRGAGVSDDVAPDGLGRVLGEAHPVGIGHDLIADEDGDSKLFREASQLTQELSHLHLPFGQLSSAGVVGPEQGRGRIDDDQGVAILGEDGGGHLEKFPASCCYTCRIIGCETKKRSRALDETYYKVSD